ncbi:hypothetical protein NDU88_003104 [Pleurodeles waltl]|uniref:Uncharacterized protein n=1 Tax=Pleurodeles waltl TaxID=8319 RepID=A0AAV7VEF0_PLEWA|nr:hypothetical protein NDU88_003104 [Pleurodeles waltl]
MHCLIFTQGRLCVNFRCSVVDPLRVVGFSEAPGTMRGFPTLAGRSHRSCIDSVGVALHFLPHDRRSLCKSGCVILAQLCVDPVGHGFNFRSLHRRCVDLLNAKSGCAVPVWRAGNFSPQCRLCVVSGRLCIEFRRTRSPSCRDEVFLVLRLQGTEGNLYPNPLERASSPQPESSKAEGQQQGSSPSQKADRWVLWAARQFFLAGCVFWFRFLLQEVSELVG